MKKKPSHINVNLPSPSALGFSRSNTGGEALTQRERRPTDVRINVSDKEA